MEPPQQQPPQQQAPEIEEKEQEKVIKLLEERLKKHDDNRKVVQSKLTEILTKLTEQVDGLEDRINRELCEKFISEEDRLQRTLNELRGSSTISVLQKVKVELHTIQSYEIIKNNFEPNNDITALYELKAERRTILDGVSAGLAISEMNSSTNNPSNTREMCETPCDSVKFAEERERLIGLLEELLEEHDENKKAAQDKLHEVCERLRAQISELEDRINKELEDKFTSEDNRFQAALNELRGNSTISALQKAKAELLVEQLYKILDNNFDPKHDLTTLYELKVERRIVPELMKNRKPTNVRVTDASRGIISVEFTCLNLDEERVLSNNIIVNPVKFKCMLFKKCNGQESKKEYPLNNNDGNDSFFTFTPNFLEAKTTYGIRVKIVVGDRESEWSNDIAEFTTPKFNECCVWKKCPYYVIEDKKYSVDEGNPRIATKVNSNGWCTIIGNTLIPLNTVISLRIKMLKSKYNGEYIYIGVAPPDINQNDVNWDKCGWYFDCFRSVLFSGPPHSYDFKEYGPRKEWYGEYVHERDSVGVVMDTTKGELSFVLNGVNLGVAYEGIPLDKPLVPCVLLWNKGDYVEFII